MSGHLDCVIEAVRTNPGYGIATLIYNNLLNLILGTVMLLRSNYIKQEKKYFCIYISNLLFNWFGKFSN